MAAIVSNRIRAQQQQSLQARKDAAAAAAAGNAASAASADHPAQQKSVVVKDGKIASAAIEQQDSSKKKQPLKSLDYYRRISQDTSTTAPGAPDGGGGAAGAGGQPNAALPQWPPPRRQRQNKKAMENRANFRKRNKIEQLDGEDGVYRASSSANVVLYVGLGMIAIGLVITFVGLGDKGFRDETLELKLIGPSLVGCGVFFALLRVMFCTIPSCCSMCVKCCKKKEDTKALIQNDKPGSGLPQVSSSMLSNGSNLGTEHRRVAPSSASVAPTPQHQQASSALSATSSGRQRQQHPNFISDDEDEFEKRKGTKETFRQKHIRTAPGKESSVNAKQNTLSSDPRARQYVEKDSRREGDTKKSSGGTKSHKPLFVDNYSLMSDESSVFSHILGTNAANDDGEANIRFADYHHKVPKLPASMASPAHHAGSKTEIMLSASRLQVESET